MKKKKLLIILLVLMLVEVKAQTWIPIKEGVEFTEIEMNIWIFKIDPSKYSFTVKYGPSFSKDWIADEDYKIMPNWLSKDEIGINLNMFSGSYLPNGYTKIEGKVLQKELTNYNLFLVWSKDSIKILDKYAITMEEILSWPNVSQNIRLISEKSIPRNRWAKDAKSWSVSLIADTFKGDILFIHSRFPYTMNEMGSILLESNLNIKQVAYLEGGPESSVYITSEYNRMGSYETGYYPYHDNLNWAPLPFVLTGKLKK